MVVCIVDILFLCKQKTAYEMRISDWSSDVCSSDPLDVDACLRIVKRCTQQLPERRGFAIVVDRRVVRGIASPLVLNQARALEASKVGRYSALRQIRNLGQLRD